MGYSTDLYGEFSITPDLEPKHVAYLNAFSGTRRMKRNPLKTAKLPDPIREAVGLQLGVDGGYFVGAINPEAVPDESDSPWGLQAGQQHTSDIVDYNAPPAGQPGLWCQWVPDYHDTVGWFLTWDGGEKFYNYIKWLKYLIVHFLKPWGYTLNGTVEWQGEDRDDRGAIKVEDNVIQVGHQPVGSFEWRAY